MATVRSEVSQLDQQSVRGFALAATRLNHEGAEVVPTCRMVCMWVSEKWCVTAGTEPAAETKKRPCTTLNN